jgi:hypothetical protein
MTAEERAVRDRIGDRLQALGERHPSMKAFRRTKHVNQHGIRYFHGWTQVANPEYARKLEERDEKNRKENLGGKAAMALPAAEFLDVYAADGISIMISFVLRDLGPMSQAAPLILVGFGRYEILNPHVAGPDTPEYRATMHEIYRILNEECTPLLPE